MFPLSRNYDITVCFGYSIHFFILREFCKFSQLEIFHKIARASNDTSFGYGGLYKLLFIIVALLKFLKKNIRKSEISHKYTIYPENI